MARTTLFNGPFIFVQDADGVPLVGAKITTFIAGTTTPTPVYRNSSGGSVWTQPLVTNGAGITTGPVYVEPTPALKIVVVDADDVPVAGFPMDNWSPAAVATA